MYDANINIPCAYFFEQKYDFQKHCDRFGKG